MALPKSIKVTIPATQVQRKFGDVVRRVHSGREHFVVERDGLPVAAIISIAEYEAFMQESQQREQEKQQRMKQFREAARAIGEEVARHGLSEDQLMELLEASRQEVFDEHYAHALRDKPSRDG
jgi:prevent-host-death family protein